MTHTEAVDRARKIWGDGQVREVTASYICNRWGVYLENGNIHELDEHGHATCHEDCATAEWMVTE